MKNYLDLKKKYNCETFKKSITEAESSEGMILDIDEFKKRYKNKNSVFKKNKKNNAFPW